MELDVLSNIVKLYHENKLSHAYLIETNNIDKCFNDLIITIKKIFCENDYKTNCNLCNICHLIEQGNLPSLYVIKPDGINIKKEQVMELKKKFSSIPIYTKENIYVILNAEKLNGASANTMLKFLEEPEPNILGFFVTNNVNNVISTVRSRCEILKVIYDENSLDISNLFSDDIKEMLDVTLMYIYKLEVEKSLKIMYNRDVILNKFSEREDIKKIFNIMLIIYEELLKYVMGLNNNFNFSNIELLKKYNKEQVLSRIMLISKFIEDIDSNANIELLLDKFVIELGDLS